MSQISVGSVSVDVVPNASRFGPDLRAVVVPEAARIGEEIGRAISDRVAANIRDGIQSGLRGGNPGAQGAEAGNAYGGEFSRVVKTKIEAALRSLPEVQIGVATTAAEQKLRDLHARLEELRDKRIGVDIDAKDALAEVEKIRIELDRLAHKSPDIQVRVDAAKAVAELAAVKAEVDKLDAKHADVKVDSSAASAGISGLVTGIAAIGPALIPIAAVATAGLGGIGTVALAGAAGVGVLALALHGVSAAVTAVNAQQASSATDAKAYATAQAGAAAAVEGAQASLANAVRSADNSSISSAQAVQTARVGLANAIATADNAAISSAEAVGNAQQALDDATRAAGISVTNAVQAEENAERTLTQALQTEQVAQDALTAARKTAQQQIEDLTLSVQDGALSQRGANLAVQTSKIALDKVLANPASSKLQREQAQLTYDQAVQHVKDLGVQQDRLRTKQADAVQAGVDGSTVVIAAQDRIATSVRAVDKAQDNVAKTTAAVAEAQRAGLEKIGNAQLHLADAQRAQDAQARTSAQSVTAAQQGVTNALRAQDQQAVSSAASVAAAQLALTNAERAQKTAADQVSSSAQAAATALAALTPAGREFVTFITGTMQPALKKLQATAAAGLLPGLQSGLAALLPIMPLVNTVVRQVSTAMGDLFSAAGKALDSPFYRQFITFIGDEGSKTLTTFGRIIGNLATGFAGLLMAFAPVTDAIGAGLLGLSQKFADFGKNTGASSGFQSFMVYVKEVGPLVVDFFSHLGSVLGKLIEGLAPFGAAMLGVLDKTVQLLDKLGPTGLIATLATAGVAFAAFKGGLGPVSLAMTGVTAAFTSFYSTNKDFKNFVDTALVPSLKSIGANIQLASVKPPPGGATSPSFWDALKGAVQGTTTAVTAAQKANNFLSGDWNVYSTSGEKAAAATKSVADAADRARDSQNKLHDTQKQLTDATGKLNDEVQKSISKFTILRTGTLDAMTASDSLAAAYDALSKSFAQNGASLDGNTEAGRANRKAINDVAQALNDKATADFKTKSTTDGLSAATDQATSTVEANRQKLIQNLIQTGLSRQAAEDYTAKLLLTPEEIRTQVNTPGLLDAHTNVDALQQKISGLQDKSITVNVTGKFDPDLGGIQDAVGNIHVPGGGVLLKALGGSVHGPGGPRGDKIPALLSDNEHILPADEVNMLGGQRGVYALRQVIRAGELPMFAAGGAVNYGGLNVDPQLNAGAGVDRTVTVQGTSNFDNFNTGLEVGMETFAKVMGAEVFNAFAAYQARQAAAAANVGGGSGAIPTGEHLALIDQALAADGIPGGDWPRWEAGMDTLVGRESGWNPGAINLSDSNAAAGHPSQGLTQTIPSTFDAFRNSSLPGGITDGVANIAASVNYIRNRYGDISAVQQANPNLPPLGYDAGGWLKPGDVGMNFTGRPEAVLTPEESVGLKAGMNGGGASFGGGKDVTVNVYPQQGQSPEQIAGEVKRQLLFEMR